MKTFENETAGHLGMLILVIAAIPNPDPREPSPDLTEPSEGYSSDNEDELITTEEDSEAPNTDLSGIKDDRTHDTEKAQAEQAEKDDTEKPDLSGEINV
ncbi:hypothetical protein ABTW24_08375 [Sphingobacterium thalpophilum]|uniref:Uncharacterized protein n=1 Tax=Sphingobacterium thalpophilum TaxID=259 RepID=A0ABV4HDE1_9SPHI|nr:MULTISPECIES: hypothetical protein [Sphingobacterium]MCW8313981.1 hypothetical protein [Sphingobacterium sp. InxBP1]